MVKLINHGLICLEIILLSVSPLTAQEVDRTKECQNAIVNTQNQLENGRDLQVVDTTTYDSGYSDHPEGRPNQYSFGVKGTAVDSVFMSPVFLNTLAEQIINSCNSVSLVAFSLTQTDYVVKFGLMPNGKVEPFQCPADFEGHPYWRDFKWGESC